MMDRRIGKLTLGSLPRVVGTLATHHSLDSVASMSESSCDVVEVRLDEIGPKTNGWLKKCLAIEAMGFPVLLTLRLASEGGKWKGGDRERAAILSSALDCLSCIDVEATSELRTELSAQAQDLKKSIVVSYHNFEQTPSFEQLKEILGEILEIPCAIPKISTMVNRVEDITTLRKLLDLEIQCPICIIGMGSEGTSTRVLFPSLGSCLTYGYLDSPSAPGQLPASRLIEHLRQLFPKYNEDVIIRKKILEFV